MEVAVPREGWMEVPREGWGEIPRDNLFQVGEGWMSVGVPRGEWM